MKGSGSMMYSESTVLALCKPYLADTSSQIDWLMLAGYGVLAGLAIVFIMCAVSFVKKDKPKNRETGKEAL